MSRDAHFNAEKIITEYLRELLHIEVGTMPTGEGADPAWADYAEVRDQDGNRVGFIHMDEIRRLAEKRALR